MHLLTVELRLEILVTVQAHIRAACQQELLQFRLMRAVARRAFSFQDRSVPALAFLDFFPQFGMTLGANLVL